MNKLLDILLPRFITEEVALRDDGDHLVIACSMRDVKPGETFAAVGSIRSFNLLGQAIFPRTVGEPRPWPGDLPVEELPTLADQLGLLLEPCPFCAGTPAIVIANELSEGVAERSEHYGCEGLEVDPHAFCHECGARGPEGFDIIFTAEDYDEAARQAANRWNERAGLSGPSAIAQAELALLQRVEQMAAYCEAPKFYFDWIDQQKAMRPPTGTGSPAGQNLPKQEADQ